MTLIFSVVFVALVFEYINGFHDTANAIATSVSTKVLTPRQAILLSSVFNLLGALTGTAVAKTIGAGLVDTQFITLTTIMCALIGAIIWNLITWWVGIPSSSSHALVGGLCGAALGSAQNNLHVINWMTHDTVKNQWTGLVPKVIIPMVAAPIVGLLVGFIVMGILLVVLRRLKPHTVNKSFGILQWFSAAWMSFSHGTNDAQKTMGIIALALFTATTKTHAFDTLPHWLHFLQTPKFDIHAWVKVVCAITMAAGTAAGGWRIIKTLGNKLVKMQPIHGFAAQSTAAMVIEAATHWGIPLSTTHVITSAILGVGATKRLNAVKWPVMINIVIAWILTIPVTATVSYVVTVVAHWLGA
jgi:inorganic phosphate transporter, PiT family